MMAPVPRPEILEIAPYVGGESSVPGVNRVIKLASNENPFGPSPLAVAAIKDALGAAHRYPDGSSQALRDAIGATHRLDPERIVCGAGSDEILTMLARLYSGPGEEVLYSAHGFLMYPIAAKAAGSKPISVPERELTTDVDALLAAQTEATRIVYIANPNNPTGSCLSAEEVRRLREGLRPDILLVIDAAYAEYVDWDAYSDAFDLVDAADNVVVTRTFSKIYGLGGVRLGWGYCPPGVADVLNRLRTPFNVSSLAQAAGIAALADTEFVERSQVHNRQWRTWTTARLRELGLDVPDSHGNFILIGFPLEPGRDAIAADGYLKRRGLIARRMVSYGLPHCLRLTIGLGEEMHLVVSALAEFLGQPHD